jgi:hypothetical protein
MPLHEREVQRPPREADHRHPDQLLLEEELQQRHAAVQHVLQHEDVDPGLVVAVDEVPALVAQFLESLHVPRGALGQAHPAAVAGDPEAGNPVEHRIDAHAHRRERQHELDQRRREQQGTPEQRVQHQKDQGQAAAQEGWKEAEHGDFVRIVAAARRTSLRQISVGEPVRLSRDGRRAAVA